MFSSVCYPRKKRVDFLPPHRPTRSPPADLASASLDLAALEYQARHGKIILLYEDETILWRFALPRAGWWRKAQRARLPTRPLSQSQIKRDESLKRQTWLQYRSWSRITSGVLLSVIGAVQYGTSKVCYTIVPHFDAQELRQYLHQVMTTFGKTGKDVVMVVDRSGIHRAHKLETTFDALQRQVALPFLTRPLWAPPQSHRSVPDATYKNDLVSPQALSADDAPPEGWLQKGERNGCPPLLPSR